MTFHALVVAATIVATWNGNWFPSGRAEHRAHPDVEAATIEAAAKMLAKGLAEIDPAGTNDIILCLHEMRGPRVVSNLVEKIGRKGLKMASISGYRRRDRFDQQQDAIATTLPVADAGWSKWRTAGKETPPRGYAYAAIVVEPAVTANVYAVHLKSNYNDNTDEKRALSRAKRTHSIVQLLEQEKPKRGKRKSPVVIAGDMNADKWGRGFEQERIFSDLESAGFVNLLETLPPGRRGIHPSARYGDSALDYVFVRGASGRDVRIVPNDNLSDHFAVFSVLDGWGEMPHGEFQNVKAR